jgi:DNA replication protein DnaC
MENRSMTTTSEHKPSAFAEMRERLGIPADASGGPSPIDGTLYMTHAEYDEKYPQQAERAQEEVNRGKVVHLNRFGTEVGYVPSRSFPCPGDLLIPDVVMDSDMPAIDATCTVCRYNIGFQRSSFDPEYALKRRYLMANLPAHFQGKKMDPVPEQSAAREMMRQWLVTWPTFNDDPDGRIPVPALYGLPGRGKSHLLCSVAETLMRKQNVDIVYWPLSALLAKVRSGFGDEVDDATKVDAAAAWGRALAVPLLVLDDIGAERPTEWAVEQIQLLVDHRFSHSLPILLASNIPPEAWDQMFGGRTGSRLRGMTYPFEVGGRDLRQQHAS